MKVKYYINNDVEVWPVNSGIYSFKSNEGKVNYDFEAKDKFKFKKGKGYEIIMAYRQAECDKLTLCVKTFCGTEYKMFWQGEFSVFDCEIDEDECYLIAKVENKGDDKNLEDKKDEEVNVYDGVEINVQYIAGEYQTITCVHERLDESAWDVLPDNCLDNKDLWCLLTHNKLTRTEEDINGRFKIYRSEAIYHREVYTTNSINNVPQLPEFGSNWTLLKDNGNGTATFWRCPSLPPTGEVLGPYKHGRRFAEFSQNVFADIGLTVKSNFFNINRYGGSPDNDAYLYAENFLQNLTVHQKSDIKNKYTVNNSTPPSWIIKPEDYINDMYVLFNVLPHVIGDTLYLEHYTHYSFELNKDLTDAENVRNKYDFSGNKNVKTENFTFHEECSAYFKTGQIVYTCGKEKKDNTTKIFLTDIGYIEEKGREELEETENAEELDNAGFVLVSNGLIAGEYVINDNNTPLSFTKLLTGLHTSGRLYKEGKINGNFANFTNWKPYVKAEKFKINFLPCEVFSPLGNFKTTIGEGILEEAEIDIYKCTNYVTLKY